jgi:hypothetical protein
MAQNADDGSSTRVPSGMRTDALALGLTIPQLLRLRADQIVG